MKSGHSNGFRFQAGNKKGKTFDFELSCYHCYNQVAELNYVFLILQKSRHTDIIFWVPVLLFLSIHYSCITEKGSFPIYIYSYSIIKKLQNLQWVKILSLFSTKILSKEC